MKRWIHASSDVKDHVLDDKTLKQWVDCFISSDDIGTSVEDAINFIEEGSMSTLTSDERSYVNKRIAKSIHASIDEGYTSFIDENDIPEAVQIFLDTPDEKFDADAGRMVKNAVDAYIEEYKKFPSSRTMESLDIKYDQDKGRFYRKYRPFVDKCCELIDKVNPSGYGMYDSILLKMRDRLRAVDYNFPYGWKNH